MESMLVKNKNPLKIVVVSAHPDDEALGAGGTILKYKEAGHEVHLLFISDGITSRTLREDAGKNRTNEFINAMNFLKPDSYKVLKYPDNKLDSVPLLEITKEIEFFLGSIKPDVLFTHFAHDLNVDHRLVSQACITATRPGSETFVRKILSFEILSSTGWNLSAPGFFPNYYVNITDQISKKVAYLQLYNDEIKKLPHARSLENVVALSQLRGSEVFVDNAEGFILLRSLKNDC